MTVAPGSQLGPYRIVSQLGQGGMGVVYLAHDPRLDRHVAIKLLPPDLTRDETAKQRFLQEAKAASALDHPNICNIHEINETDDGQLYLVMAHYEGETLKERIARGPLELNDAIDIATQVGQGLAEAHGAGIVHRDIKPANLLVTKTSVVKVPRLRPGEAGRDRGPDPDRHHAGYRGLHVHGQARGQEVNWSRRSRPGGRRASFDSTKGTPIPSPLRSRTSRMRFWGSGCDTKCGTPYPEGVESVIAFLLRRVLAADLDGVLTAQAAARSRTHA